MKRVMKQRAEAGLQPGYDPKTQQMAGTNKKYTFGKSWAIRFKKRKKIKRRRRTNKKNPVCGRDDRRYKRISDF